MRKTKPPGKANPVATRKPTYTEATFVWDSPQAQEVFVVGDFNDWARGTLPLRKHDRNGQWKITVPLPPGRYEYKFIVDGPWLPDPQASENVPNPFGSVNSVIKIKP